MYGEVRGNLGVRYPRGQIRKRIKEQGLNSAQHCNVKTCNVVGADSIAHSKGDSKP